MKRPKYQIQDFDYHNPPPNFRDDAEIRQVLKRLEAAHNHLENYGMTRHAKIIKNGLNQAIDFNNWEYINALENVRKDGIDIPVSIDEFVDSTEFLGEKMNVWPKLREALRDMCPDILAGEKPVTEVYNRSCIGTGKSELGKIRMAYDAYFLLCFDQPSKLYPSLSRYMQIVIVMMSIRDQITKRTLYDPARQMILDMPWIQKNAIWNKDLEATLVFPNNNLTIMPMSAGALNMIGQAIIGGHIDEANFMEVVTESKRADVPGGMYDQADVVYSALSKRRKSRFISKGPNPGCLYISSSVNYSDDFIDRRVSAVRAELEECPENVQHVRIMDFRQFDVRPDTFCGDTFRFLVGTNDYPGRVLKDEEIAGEHFPADGLVETPPIEWIDDFKYDPDKAQRDSLGISSSAIHRYMSRVDKVVDAFKRGRENDVKSFLVKQNVILAVEDLPIVRSEMLPKDLRTPRAIHIDLSRTGDRCGIAMAKIAGYANITTGEVVQTLPVYTVEMAISIEPNTLNQIDIADIRAWAMDLKQQHGLNIISVTYDGFDSQESIQQWRKLNMNSHNISMDKTTEAYDQFKQALYQDRVLLVDNDLLKQELAQLERHVKGGRAKVDHPAKGSKDIADAVVGACFAISKTRQMRNNINVSDAQGNPVRHMRRRVTERRRVSRR